MAFLAAFNRRHKAVLFLTLVAAGLGLFLGASAKQTAGVVLLGVAATWLLGALRVRTLCLSFGVLALVAGVLVLGVPAVHHWRNRSARIMLVASDGTIWYADTIGKAKRALTQSGGEFRLAGNPRDFWYRDMLVKPRSLAGLLWWWPWEGAIPGAGLLVIGLGLLIWIRPTRGPRSRESSVGPAAKG